LGVSRGGNWKTLCDMGLAVSSEDRGEKGSPGEDMDEANDGAGDASERGGVCRL
jgi:hypothetical protein